MKTRKYLISLFCVIMVVAMAIGIVGCTKINPAASEINGEYYCDTQSGEYTVTLKDGKITLKQGDKVVEGSYDYDKTNFTVKFKGNTTGASGEYTDGVLKLTYNGATYSYLKKVEYTVKFMDGTTEIKSAEQNVINGKAAKQPADPEKEGNYKFITWYADANFTKVYNFATPITQDTQIYARFGEYTTGEEIYKVKLSCDGENYKDLETIGYKVYNLPMPTKSGSTFVGWFVSQYNDANKLSYKYEEQLIKEDSTLYAKFITDSSEPVIETVEGGTIKWTSAGVGKNYHIKIVSPKDEALVDENAATLSKAFDFTALEAGDYVITVTVDDKTATAYYKNKALARVSHFEVLTDDAGNELDIISWNAIDNAEKYILSITCGDATHDHSAVEITGSTQYNFENCAMKEGGIEFVVKAVAEGYVTSESIVYKVDRTLEKVGGYAYAGDYVTWTAVKGATSYEVTIVVGTKETKVTVEEAKVYVGDLTGKATVKVKPLSRKYNSADETSYEFDKATLAAPSDVKISVNTISWSAVTGAASYIVKIGDKEIPVANGTSYTVTEVDIVEGKTEYEVSVKAVASDTAKNSGFSTPIKATYGKFVTAPVYKNKIVTWDVVLGAASYGVKIDTAAEVKITDGARTVTTAFDKDGKHTVVVTAYKADGTTKLDSATLEVNVYKLVYDVTGGEDVKATYYYADTDVMTITETSQRYGYTFEGWYNAATGNAKKYVTGDAYDFGKNGTLYARWTPKEYTVLFDLSGYGSLDADVATKGVKVKYGEAFELPVPNRKNSDGTDVVETTYFSGWYSEAYMSGVQYTDKEGKSRSVWANAKDNVVLIAGWAEKLTFREVGNSVIKDKIAYSVSAGPQFGNDTAIKIPATYKGNPVTIIEANAFYYKRNLATIEIPSSIQTIEIGVVDDDGNEVGAAFGKCTSLKEIKMYTPEDPTLAAYIEASKYTVIDGSLVTKTGTGDDMTYDALVYVPTAKIDGYKIPVGIKTIPLNLFKGRSKLTSVTIPYTVTRIEAKAFANCSGLKNIIFEDAPEGTAESEIQELYIDSTAFTSCSGITEVHFPARLAQGIDIPTLFASSKKLANIYVAEGSKYYNTLELVDDSAAKGEDGKIDESKVKKANVLTNQAGNEIIFAPIALPLSEVKIPSQITSIGEGAFMKNTTITKVTFDASVTSIGNKAFYEATELAEIVFAKDEGEEDPLTIGDSAFESTGIEALIVPARTKTIGVSAFDSTSIASLEFEGSKDDNITICTGAFAYVDLDSLVLAPSVKKIESGAFKGCWSLKQVTINCETDVNFELDAFPSYVTSLTIGKLVPTLELNGIFGTNVSIITVDGDNKNYKVDDNVVFSADGTKLLLYPANKVGSYTIPSTVEYLGSKVFYGKTQIYSITISKNVTYVGAYTFNDCTGLTTVTFDEGGEKDVSIEQYAFGDCSNLVSLNLSSKIKTIGAYAFSGCSRLSSVTIPEGVTSLGERAFEDCSMLSTVSLPSTLERMGTYASNGDEEYLASYDVFSGCKMLSSVTVDSANEKFTSIGGVLYTKKDGDAQILFYAPVNVSGEITIPATATEIKADVFADHRRVTAVKFAGALEGSLTIGENAFSGCTSLKTLELVEGVTTIGANAFNKCSALVSVNIPASVTLIERGAFNSCAALSSLTFDNGNEETLVIADSVSDYGYDSDAYGVFAKDAALTNVVFPTDRALSLGSYAFIDCANLESVTFGKDVVAFGSNVFKKCRKLKTLNDFDKISSLKSIPDNFLANTAITSIVVPEGVETMGVSVFEDCTNLVDASLPASLTHIGKQYSASYSSTGYYITYEARTFAGCYALENVTFANDSKLERINMSMFLDCVSLKSVELPDTIERIEQQAFYGSGIESITIPASVTKLDFFAFMNCKDLTTVNFATEGGISQLRTMEKRVFANSGLTSFTFPTTIVPISLNEGIFENCKDLETITLSKTVTNLGDSLYGNYSIKNIIVADENKNYLVDSDSESGKVIYNVSKTVLKTFVGVWNSDTFEIPEGVTEISSKAFEGQYRIKKIIVPASVNKIGTSAFKSCVGLEEIEFADYPELTESGIGNYIFQFCSNLKTVTLPSTFTTIPKYMFSYSNVETVKISEKVTAIADYAFAYAYNFKKLEGVTADTEIKVKTIGASAFRESLMTSFFVPDSVTSLGNYVFYKCANLTSVTGMKNVTTIGADAFEYTTSLKEFSLPAGVTTLSNYLFSHSGVENIKNTEKVTSVGKYVFQYCENLKTIDLSSVTTIGNYAFRESGISSIALPKLKTLGTYAFDACVALESVDLGASSLSKLDKYTFQNCTSLTDFVFPTTLTSLELYSLSATKIVIADLSNTKLTTINPQVFRDNKVLSVVILPETTNKVGAYAFQDCTSLKYINLAKVKTIDYNAFMNTALYSVDLASCTSLNSSGLQFSGCKELVEVKNFTGTSVPKQMFENCTSLRSIDLSNVVTINANAFNGCTALKKADLSVAAKIGDKAFYGSGLTEVTISDDLTSRGSNIFTGSDIKEFKLAKASKVYSVKDGALYIGDMLIYYPSAKVPNEGKENEGTLVLPESYADGAFEGAKGIRKLVVGKNVQTIVSGTFANCVNLTEVAFEEGSILVSIGDEAFMGCSALETVTLPKTLNVIGDYAFADTGLKSVVIPSSALVLGDGAFSGCSALASVTLPEGVVSLGNEAFQNTTSLKNIILPESLRNIGDYTFNGSGIESIVVPEGVTVIGNTLASRVGGFVFANCESLVSVTFKGDIVSIAPSTFVNSTSLSTVLFRGQTAAEDGSVVLPNTLVTLGNMAFNNTGITGVVIPESVIELGTQTFAENAKLKKAVINAGGLVSGSAAFLNCTALTEVKFGENVTSLGEALNSSNYTVYKNGHMFDGCTALSKVDLGSLEVIADYMFAGTTSLESITLPANAKIISVYAFSGSGLKSINLNEGLYRIDASAFVDCASLESIVIPSTVGDWYTFMYNGAHKTNILLNSFSTSTFKGCKSLKTVEFKCYMPTIGGSMFEGCTSLQSIKFTSTPADKTGLVIPSGIAIGPYAFAGIGSDKTLELLGDYNEACKGSYISTTRTWYDNCDAKIIIDGKVFKEADVA